MGWVIASDLSELHEIHEYLRVNRENERISLYRDGHAVFNAPVGVGRPGLPTPSGHFFVTEKLLAIGGPVYGPFALGTSAYAPSPQRMARRRGGGHPRHRRTAAGPRPSLPRLHPHAQRRHQSPVADGRSRHPDRNRLTPADRACARATPSRGRGRGARYGATRHGAVDGPSRGGARHRVRRGATLPAEPRDGAPARRDQPSRGQGARATA